MFHRNQLQLHPFHLVAISPWPIFISFSLLSLTVGGVLCFHGQSYISVTLGFVATLYCIILWLRDVVAEGSYLGEHTTAVQRGLSLGFLLFVISEVMFFFSLFWAYLHSGLTPGIEVGTQWPPVGIDSIDPFALPLLNTVILLGSGAAVTFAHHALLNGDRASSLNGIILTVILALLFTACQVLEYYNSDYSLSDSVYGASFFLATGFHSFHIIIGTAFILVGAWRIFTYQVSREHHVGIETGILYWHFVDVVWLILFALMYVWASL